LWVKVPSFDASEPRPLMLRSTSDSPMFVLVLDEISGETTVKWGSYDGSSWYWVQRNPAWSYTNSDWHLVVCTADIDSGNGECDLQLSVDGDAFTLNDDAKVDVDRVPGFVRISYPTDGSVFALDGDVAELAMWDEVLDNTAVQSLYKRFSPRLIRPSNLIAYWPLVRNRGSIVGGSYLLTSYNSPVVSEHCPIIG
jgi:hypothetical protein